MVYDFFDTKCVGLLFLSADEQGVRYIRFENTRKPVPIENDLNRDPGYFKHVKTQLSAYFNHELKQFDFPLAPKGTVFQQAVWKTLQKIPYGTVTTYQWVANQIRNPKAVRAVGAANGKNPIAIVIPCHRVIGSNGSLTGFGGGLDVKQRLINLEKQAG
jgi:methylated-DNA-[protein]-cysteine S-methyltransferase